MTMNTSLQASFQCASNTERRCKKSSNIEDTGQNVPRVMLSALEGKAKVFLVCEAATKVVLSRVNSTFSPINFRIQDQPI